MMEVRQMAVAFLLNQDRILMIKKSNSSLYDKEFWGLVGGHIEPEEINNPRKACVREIFEETGLQEKDIFDLSLKYILLRQKEPFL